MIAKGCTPFLGGKVFRIMKGHAEAEVGFAGSRPAREDPGAGLAFAEEDPRCRSSVIAAGERIGEFYRALFS
jgi:hypothetical protein